MKEESESTNDEETSTSTPTEASATEHSSGETDEARSSSNPENEIIQENSDDWMNPQSSTFEDFTEEDLANIEIIEYEFEDPNMSLKDLSIFDKSLSLADLRVEHQEEVPR